MNPLCPCRKAGAWRDRASAEERLAEIQAAPDAGRMYQPVRVVKCPHGVWHLSSKAGKVWAKGKSRRRRQP